MINQISVIFSGLSLALLAMSASAQDRRPHEREGLGISFAIGAGSASAICNACSSDRETGPSGYLRIGGHIGPKVLLGGESHGWINNENGLDEVLGFYTVTAQWFPSAAKGFYLKGGVGVSGYVAQGYGDEIIGSAPGMVLGLGHDFRVGRNFSLTPYLNFLKSGDFDLELNGIAVWEDISADVWQAGFGFTWH